MIFAGSSLTQIFTVGSLFDIRSHLKLNSSSTLLIWSPLFPCERKPYGYLLLLCSCCAPRLEHPLCFFPQPFAFWSQPKSILFVQFFLVNRITFLSPNPFYPDRLLPTTFFIDFFFLTLWVFILDLVPGTMSCTNSLETLEKYSLHY